MFEYIPSIYTMCINQIQCRHVKRPLCVICSLLYNMKISMSLYIIDNMHVLINMHMTSINYETQNVLKRSANLCLPNVVYCGT
jgi:hypothetical protein